MKPSVILPVVTAAAGFAAGWLLKPSPDLPPAAEVKPARREALRPAPTAAEPTSEMTRPGSAASPPAANRQQDDSGNVAIQSLDDAKMARLTEALNLNPEQQQAILKAMTTSEAALNPEEKLDPLKMLDIAVGAGIALEKELASILSPEQAAAFTSLRKRSQDNSIETSTQDRVATVSKLTDLSPEQREMALQRERETVRKNFESRPRGLDLVLDTSILPTGPRFIAESSVESLRLLGGSDPEKQAENFRDLQRQNLDARAELYKDILTPAQQARLQLDIQEKKRVIDRVAELGR